ALAGLLILPQSILLGTTFPLMSAAVLRAAPSRPGNVLSWLYFTNSLGGAIGVLIAGFLLVRIAGLPGVLAGAAVLNLVVALVAFVLSKRLPNEMVHVSAAPPSPASSNLPPPIALPRLQRLLLGVAFGTAVASFAYEIDWIRMLALVLGSATHAFELMLSAFILGLAIGAISIRKLDTLRSPLHTLGTVQVAMGLLAIFTLPVYVASFEWFTTIMAMVNRTDAGYTGFSVLRYGLCLLVMLPSTICAGMTLPLITRSLMVGGGGEGAIGKVYAWNTLGAIVGVALAALVLLPGLGLKPMLLLAGGLDIALGLLVFHLLAARRRVAIGAALGAMTIGAIALTVPLDRALLTSGVFRSGSLALATDAKVVYYADGRTATVAVGEGENGGHWISTNGKPDASLGPWWQEACSDTTARRLGGDEITQTLLPLVTAAYHPAARTAAVIGFGSGMSSHLLLGIPSFTSVTTLEIEPKMIEGARVFLPANARVYEDPRSHLVIGDAKAHFAAAAERWDVILSEPSNPWVSGVSGLFTVEFYVRVKAALADGGVFGQWLHTYELSDNLVLSVLAGIDAVFPSWRVHQVGPGDLLVIASAEPQLPVMNADAVLRA
ncbi:MAG: spermidine synthase, partial [Gemmatimonadetes bacterium HGW-Gemmatimonadetes-1]